MSKILENTQIKNIYFNQNDVQQINIIMKSSMGNQSILSIIFTRY